ncbi:hypothetical protein Clacol_009995 [Clathrus columnatus]|uniref:Uncharacterized protein n=1 Tax=Clathrus columnatus TaxID=1419009 RepID=A0AAV5APN7_9AGAM|nr:hypothetical protein Clacol_009995 [Clathrus columnatus]
MVLAVILDADLDDDQDSPILIASPDPLDVFLIATTTTLSPFQHNIAPSPSHRTMAPLTFQRSIASTPQGGPSAEAQGSPDPLILSYSSASIRAVRKTLQKLQDITSRRIPDFVRLRFYNYNTVNVSHRVGLIIEVKRLPTDRAERDVLSQAQMQVNEQAYHAFQLGPDSPLLKLGCLIILGNE